MNYKNTFLTLTFSMILITAHLFFPILFAAENNSEIVDKEESIYVVLPNNGVYEMTKEQTEEMEEFEGLKVNDVSYMPVKFPSIQEEKTIAFFDYELKESEGELPLQFFLRTDETEEGLPTIHLMYDNFTKKENVELKVIITANEDTLNELADSELALYQVSSKNERHSLGTFFAEKNEGATELIYTITIDNDKLKEESPSLPNYFLGEFEGEIEATDDIKVVVSLEDVSLPSETGFVFEKDKYNISSETDPLAVVKKYEAPAEEEIEIIEEKEEPEKKEEEKNETTDNSEETTNEEKDKETIAEEKDDDEKNEKDEANDDTEVFLLDEKPEDMSLEEKHGVLPQMNTKTTLIPLVIGLLIIGGAIYYRKRKKKDE